MSSAGSPAPSSGVVAVAAEAATPPVSTGPQRTEFLGGTIRAGRAVYQRQVHMGHEFAVLEGKSLVPCPVQDKEFVFAIKKDRSSGREFFVHIPTKHKSWDLPDRSNPHAVAAIDIVLANPWRERFIAFYKQYNADKLPFVDPTLAQFPGRERVLMNALVRKYGAEPGHEDEYDRIVAEDEDEVATPREDPDADALAKASIAERDEVLRKRVTRFVAHYKPNKATPSAIDKLLNKYAGHESELIQFLVEKFGPEPPEPAAHECDEPALNQPAMSPEKSQEDLHQEPSSTISVPALDTAAAAGERNVLLREQSLMGFLQDREARLESALSRNADLTSELDQLRSRNETLLNEACDLRNQVEIESKQVDGSLSRLKHDASVSLSNFELERTKLRQQLQEELLEVRRRHGDEQVLHEKAISKFSAEKSEIKSQLSTTKEELDNAMQRTSELISALDKREITNVVLRRENERMKRKLNPERADSASQTDELALVPGMVAHVYDERAEPSYLATHDFISRNRIVALENALHRARQECERHAAELHRVHSGAGARGSQYDAITSSPPRQPIGTPRSLVASPTSARSSMDANLTIAELRDKLTHAYATVSSLRTANKHLEGRVGQLELKVISMPNPELTPRNTAMSSIGSPASISRIEGSPAANDLVADTEEDAVADLRERLAASNATVRVQKGEINDLRMLLARYMSYSGATPNRKATSAQGAGTPSTKGSPASSRKPISPAA